MQDPTEKHISDVGILDKYNYNNNLCLYILTKQATEILLWYSTIVAINYQYYLLRVVSGSTRSTPTRSTP
jgi:hypothetical protein